MARGSYGLDAPQYLTLCGAISMVDRIQIQGDNPSTAEPKWLEVRLDTQIPSYIMPGVSRGRSKDIL